MSILAKRTALIVHLALQDLWHERKISFCIVASLVAVIAPLLLLFGLKHGVVTQLQEELLRDPRNLEVRMLTSASHDAEWLNALRQREDVGFAVGQVRSLNAQADLYPDARQLLHNVEMSPSAAGDPLLADLEAVPQSASMVLSASAARRLDVSAGEGLTLGVNRRRDGKRERGRLDIRVAGVLEPARYSRPAAFVDSQLLVELERFRDGRASETLGVTTGIAPGDTPVRYARARLYASDIDVVEGLVKALEAEHIDTHSRLAEIQNVNAINRLLGLIFRVIALTALAGCLASMAGAFIANIDRKRQQYAVLRLLGLHKTGIALHVIAQASLMALLAFVIGLGLYAASAMLFNQLLGASDITTGIAARLTPLQLLAALALTLGVALLVALLGVVRAFRIQPAESLREL
ncbi:MAG: ABC transporter permease [Halomonadaceae bacterium]